MNADARVSQPLSPAARGRVHRPPGVVPPRVIVLALVAVTVTVLSALLGRPIVSWRVLWDAEAGAGFWTIRVPRVALAAAAGAGLSIGGVIFQSLFRNPLASPYTLGVDAGASFAAALGVLVGIHGHWFGFPLTSLSAFGGAMAAMLVVLLLARGREAVDMTRILLAGVCVAYMCAAGITLVMYLAGQAADVREIMFWTMGSLGVLRPRAVLESAVAIAPLLFFAVLRHRAFDLLALGDEIAASRGVAVGRTVWTSFALVGLMTAVLVANCGPIGFVGLMAPHMARAIVGPKALPLIISSALLGAAFLALCDGVARAVSTYDLPVGVITNTIGAAFFILLLSTQRSR